MAIIDAEGVVTKETKYGDSSRILTVITKNLGKISVMTGNVRRGKSGLLSATELFAYSRFTLFKGASSSLYKLNEGELISSFSSLRESLDGIAFGSYFCDVTNFVVQEEAADVPQTELLLRCLHMLCREDANPEKIKAVFEFRTLTIAGLMPDLSMCGGCGRTDGLELLSPIDGAVYCQKCGGAHTTASCLLRINAGILAAIAYISLAEDKKIFSFNMSEASIKYLSELGESCLGILLDKEFKTLKYLRSVTALG